MDRKIIWSPVFVLISGNAHQLVALSLGSDPIRGKIVAKSPQEMTKEEWLASHASSNVTSISNNSTVDDDPEAGVVIEHAWIPTGKYLATDIGHELKHKYKGYDDKLVIEFCIVEGDYKSAIVRGFFRIKIKGKYKFDVQGGSRWVTEMRAMFPERGRKDTLPVSLLRGKVIEILVRDAKGKGNKPLPENARYSVVEKMIRVVR
jgi:hypothetical protein